MGKFVGESGNPMTLAEAKKRLQQPEMFKHLRQVGRRAGRARARQKAKA